MALHLAKDQTLWLQSCEWQVFSSHSKLLRKIMSLSVVSLSIACVTRIQFQNWRWMCIYSLKGEEETMLIHVNSSFSIVQYKKA